MLTSLLHARSGAPGVCAPPHVMHRSATQQCDRGILVNSSTADLFRDRELGLGLLSSRIKWGLFLRHQEMLCC